jgi:hypothetical protein
MKLSKLIEELQDQLDYAGDMDVALVSDYGDYTHTKQALDVECIQVATASESGYSESGWAILDCEDREDEDETREVLAISTVHLH